MLDSIQCLAEKQKKKKQKKKKKCSIFGEFGYMIEQFSGIF